MRKHIQVTRRGLSLALRNVLWAQVIGCLVAMVYFCAAAAQVEPSIALNFLAMWFGALWIAILMPLYIMAVAKLVWDGVGYRP
jgi:hypothetical protein